MSNYGWIITVDHLSDSLGDLPSEVGTIGPRDIPAEIEEQLAAGKGHTFRMYDDDGELYYTGKAILPSGDDSDNEDWLVAPLRDFGSPNAGAVLIKWHGKPDWTCEY